LVGVPLNEASEAYEVDVLDQDGKVLRTLTSTSPSVNYPASDQTTEFGTPQSVNGVAVHQMCEAVERGFAARGSLRAPHRTLGTISPMSGARNGTLQNSRNLRLTFRKCRSIMALLSRMKQTRGLPLQPASIQRSRRGIPASHQRRYARVSSAQSRTDQLRGMENAVTTVMVKSSTKPGTGRPRVQDVDRHVGARVRWRRFVLGLTQQEMAELIGVSFQQAHRYEKGLNRIAAGRLYNIAQALGVEVGYFFKGIGRDNALEITQQQRLLLELAGNFISVPARKHQEAICSLARALSDPDTRR